MEKQIIQDKGFDCSNKQYYKILLPKRAENLQGKTFGDLIALFPVRTYENKRLYWLCKCKCGNIKIVLSTNLVTNKIKSCGCLRSKTTKEHITNINRLRRINLIGETYGFLQVIELDEEKTKEKSNNGKYIHYYWKCKCSLCGNIESVRSDSLTENLKTCCSNCSSNSSQGEKEIFEILTKNNISFTRQKVFDDCRLPSGWPAKFDFYINQKVLVEFDGIQHYRKSPIPYFDYEKIHQSDLIKNNWCIKNNIPLIRIPYYKLGKITLEDLTPEKTKFLIKEGDF